MHMNTGKWTITGALCRLLAILAMASGCGKTDENHKGHGHGPDDGHGRPKALAPATASEPCAAHQAPKSLCFLCDPALREQGRLWCSEHNRYEDRCWLCHPELQDKQRLWCNEHSLYEDECFLCDPSRTKTAQSEPVGGLMCRDHNVKEAECGICRPERAGLLKAGEGLKVRLPTPDSATMTGIETAMPTVGAAADSIACFAEVTFDQNRMAHIGAPAGGTIHSVDADLGAVVAERQVLASIWSASVAEAVAKAVFSHQALERERTLHAQGIAPAKDVQEAEAAHRTACQQARTFGYSEEDVRAMGARPDEPVYLDVRAPFAGVIAERAAVRGSLVETGKHLFTLVDISTMWAMLNVPETALASVQTGQMAELTVDALPNRTFSGKVTWVAPQIDGRTRLAKVRVEVPNPDGALRDKMFAQARIRTRHAETAVLVPASAIQRVEGRPIVFVKLAGDLFDARGVLLGATHNGRVEVLAGLKSAEEVVVTHGFAVKSQLLISRLGAGCADD